MYWLRGVRVTFSLWQQGRRMQWMAATKCTSVVLTTLLSGCETWTIYRRHENLLQQFHLRCLPQHFQHPLPRQDARHLSVLTIMHKAQTLWAGHVSRMSDSGIAKQLLYGELSRGSRKVGGQRKCYKDSLNGWTSASTSPRGKLQHLTDQLGET